MLVHLVADYGVGDLAFAEVCQRLTLALPGAQVHATPVAPFDTIAAGFCVAELALTEGSPERLVVHNVAPRRDEAGPRPANQGERFCVGRTPAGVLVVGPNAGWSWSFCAPQLRGLCYLAVSARGSQFRSRDVLPRVLAGLVAGHGHDVGERVPRQRVPPVPSSVVAYVDGYGNLKTTLVASPVPVGTRVLVRIGDIAATAIVTDGTFAVAEGELALAPGSSGWHTTAGGHQRFHELFLRGGNAAQRFGGPRPGTPIAIQAADEG